MSPDAGRAAPPDGALAAVCGDGLVGVGEVCDGPSLGGETCESRGLGTGALKCDGDCKGFDSSDCIPLSQAVCGNGVVEEGEACDDGFTDACGSCNEMCTGGGEGSACGDGVTCPEFETCDDGFTDNCGSCNANCSAAGSGATCGDGMRCPEFEACDDGNTIDDLCSLDCKILRYKCDTDQALGLQSGQFSFGAANDFIPLCNGWVFIPDGDTNRIRATNVITGADAISYQLSARPDRLALDEKNDLLYVSLVGATRLARIDLVSGEVTLISLDAVALGLPEGSPAQALAVLPDGRLAAALEDGGVWPQQQHALAIIDGVNGHVEETLLGQFTGELAFDETNSQLFVESREELHRYVFDPLDVTFTQMPDVGECCGAGTDLAVSPDGTRVAYACPCGNHERYGITDYSALDLLVRYGEWDTDSYPRAAGFSPDSSHVVASNGRELQVFTTATHVKVVNYGLNECLYDRVVRTKFSRGGRLVFSLSRCGFNEDSAQIEWLAFTPPSP